MKPKKHKTLIHVFNGDRPIIGPCLIVRLSFKSKDEAVTSHSWVGTGHATKREIVWLRRHLIKQPELTLIGEHVKEAVE